MNMKIKGDYTLEVFLVLVTVITWVLISQMPISLDRLFSEEVEFEESLSEVIVLRPVIMEVTAYCPCEKCCGEHADGVTASGYVIQKGDRFAAAPKGIPFGTVVWIPGYNDGKPTLVLDRGGDINKGSKLDVYFDSHQKALGWGRQKLVCLIEVTNDK